jgi:hypothetical protein
MPSLEQDVPSWDSPLRAEELVLNTALANVQTGTVGDLIHYIELQARKRNGDDQ